MQTPQTCWVNPSQHKDSMQVRQMPNSSASGQQSKQVGPGWKEMHLARTKATSTLHRTYPVDNWNITPSEGTWMQVFPGEPEGWPSRRQRQRWRSVCRSFPGSISRQEGKHSRQGKEWDREAVTMDTRGNLTGSPETGTVSDMSQIKARDAAFGALRNLSLGTDADRKRVDFLEPGSFLQPEAQLSWELSAATSPERRAEAPPPSYMEGRAAQHPEQSESRSVVSDSLQPRGLYSPWNSLGQNTEAHHQRGKRKMGETLNWFRLKIQDDLGILNWPFS